MQTVELSLHVEFYSLRFVVQFPSKAFVLLYEAVQKPQESS